MKLIWLTGLALLMFNCGLGGSSLPEGGAVADFEVISRGEVLDLEPRILADQVTVFDFYADWCAPCKRLDQSLADLKALHGDRLVVYKLDLVSWESALAQHFQIRDLPYLMVYDGQRQVLGNGPSNQVLPKLVAFLNQ